MTRRLETGPLLVTLGAVLLLVSLFLFWFTGELTAWDAFEVWDLALAALGLAAIAAAVGLMNPEIAVVDRRWLPAAVLLAVVVVSVQIIDPPPAAAGQEPDTGAWLALGGAALMALGAMLTFSRVRIAFTVEGRDPRRHVPAVDARGEPEPGEGDEPPAAAAGAGGGGGGTGIFGRIRREPAPPLSAEQAPAWSEEDEPLRRSRARRRQRATEGEDADETQEKPS